MPNGWVLIGSWVLRALADELRPIRGEMVIGNETYLAPAFVVDRPGPPYFFNRFARRLLISGVC